jgi:hypothetical protein
MKLLLNKDDKYINNMNMYLTLNMNDTGLSALFCHLIFMVYWLCWIQVKFSTYNLGPQYLVHTLKMDGTYSYYLCICHLNLIVVSLNLDLYFSKTKYSHGRFKGKARPRSVSTRVKIFYALLCYHKRFKLLWSCRRLKCSQSIHTRKRN